MAIRKYAIGEGELEVLRGREAQVLDEHTQRLGKQVSAFSEDEKQTLAEEILAVRGEQELIDRPSSFWDDTPVSEKAQKRTDK